MILVTIPRTAEVWEIELTKAYINECNPASTSPVWEWRGEEVSSREVLERVCLPGQSLT